MAKKKKEVQKASLMDAFTDAAVKDLGPGGIYTPSGEKTRHVGVPLLSLSLEFLLGSNVLWLGSSYGLAGPTQSFKSSLAIELMRSILRVGGLGWTVETEGGKISDRMIDSLLGDLRAQHKLMSVTSVEDAQKALTFILSWLDKKAPKNDLLGAIMLDSLFGSAGQEKRKAIQKEGHAGRSFPVEALLWSSWLQVFSPTLRAKPAILLFVNHLKHNMDGEGWRHPGGDAQDFHATVYMHVSRVRSYDGADVSITQLQIKTVKHSFAMSGRKIFLPHIFDKLKNKLYFDWPGSTADLLSGDLVPSSIKDVLEVSTTAKNMTAVSRTFSCKQLGLRDVTGTELGTAVQNDPVLMDKLREILIINKYDVWDGVMPVALDVEQSHTPADLSVSKDEPDDALEM